MKRIKVARHEARDRKSMRGPTVTTVTIDDPSIPHKPPRLTSAAVVDRRSASELDRESVTTPWGDEPKGSVAAAITALENRVSKVETENEHMSKAIIEVSQGLNALATSARHRMRIATRETPTESLGPDMDSWSVALEAARTSLSFLAAESIPFQELPPFYAGFNRVMQVLEMLIEAHEHEHMSLPGLMHGDEEKVATLGLNGAHLDSARMRVGVARGMLEKARERLPPAARGTVAEMPDDEDAVIDDEAGEGL